MTVHFVVRQVSSGPARNVKYLMPRLPLVTRKALMDRFGIDRRAPGGGRERCVAKNCGRREPYLKHVIDASIRCRSSPPPTSFEMRITRRIHTIDRFTRLHACKECETR